MLLDIVYRYSLQFVQVPVQKSSTGTTKLSIIVILVPKIFRKRLHDETNKIGRELLSSTRESPVRSGTFLLSVPAVTRSVENHTLR